MKMKNNNPSTRRDFMKSAMVLSSGTFGLSMIPNAIHATALNSDDRVNVIGPRDGFAPQVGTLLSMMTWMRGVILMPWCLIPGRSGRTHPNQVAQRRAYRYRHRTTCQPLFLDGHSGLYFGTKTLQAV